MFLYTTFAELPVLQRNHCVLVVGTERFARPLAACVRESLYSRPECVVGGHESA